MPLTQRRIGVGRRGTKKLINFLRMQGYVTGYEEEQFIRILRVARGTINNRFEILIGK